MTTSVYVNQSTPVDDDLPELQPLELVSSELFSFAVKFISTLTSVSGWQTESFVFFAVDD